MRVRPLARLLYSHRNCWSCHTSREFGSAVRKVLPKVSAAPPKLETPDVLAEDLLPDPQSFGILGRTVIRVFGHRGHVFATATQHTVEQTRNDPAKILRWQNAFLTTFCAIIVTLAVQIQQTESYYKGGEAVLDTNILGLRKELDEFKKRSEEMNALLQSQLTTISKTSPSAVSDFKKKFAEVM